MGRRTLAALFLAALAARAAVALSGRLDPVERGPDAGTYDRMARDILDGHGIRARLNLAGPDQSPYVPDRGPYYYSFLPPLWPIVLAAAYALARGAGGLFGIAPPETAFALALQCAAGALLAPSAAAIGWRIGGRRAGVLCGIAAALWPHAVYYAAVLSSDALYASLLLGGCALLYEGRARGSRTLALAAGAAWGLASLARMVSVPLLPFAAAAALPGPPRTRTAGASCFLGGALLVLAPWVARNWVVHGKPVLATLGGQAFWLASLPERPPGGDCRMPDDTSRLRKLSEVEESQALLRMGLVQAREHPKAFARLTAHKAWGFLRPVPAPGGGRGVERVIAGASTLALYALAAWGLVVAPERRRVAIPLLFCAIFTAFHCVFYAVTRHRMPVEPLFFPVAAAGALDAWGRVSGRREATEPHGPGLASPPS